MAISPEYNGVEFPRNISPISFRVEESGEKYHLDLICNNESIYRKSSRNGEFSIPNRQWQKVLASDEFEMVITISDGESGYRYAPIKNYISNSEIDRYLSYRLIPPGYERWNKMGIYQRDLSSFREYTILDNRQTGDNGCLNCHTYGNHTTENSMLHYRGKTGGTIISHNGEVKKVRFNSSNELVKEATYPVWHPSCNYIAYSVNDVSQYFMLVDDEKVLEVSDDKSDIILYDIERDEVIADHLICFTPTLETFPEWSSDGRKLYFSQSGKVSDKTPLDSIRYDLYSVDFDPITRAFSNKQLVFDAASQGLSISKAKTTPCGGYIVASVAEYGQFMIWHKEADLVIIDLKSGEWRFADEINSSEAESYHSFSSSGEWMVFSSRRGDGLFTRPYITRFDSQTGSFSKPFLLPQKSAEFYDRLLYSYNLPNFSKDRFTMQREFMNKSREATTIDAQIVKR